MKRTTVVSAFFVATVFACAGCTRLYYEQSIELNPVDEQVIEVDAAKNEQKVKVWVSAPDPIAVTLTLKKNINSPKAALAEKTGVKTAEFEVTVPAGERLCIVLSSSKATTVKVKATNG